MKVSIIIPSRLENPWNLERTLGSIYENATGEFEVLLGMNGEGELPTDSFLNLKIIEFPEDIGVKMNINALAACARGKYIMKLDAHTRVSKGFDEILQQDMQPDWVVTPRFKIIQDDWSIQIRDGVEEFYDYFYLSSPLEDPRGFRFKAGGHWMARTQERLLSHPDLDETPQMHGSGWFCEKDYFFKLGGFPMEDPYGHGMEPLAVGLNSWLKGGKLMVNKKTWYAHLHQSSGARGYPEDKRQTEYTYNLIARFWMGDKEPNIKHNMAWFIDEKFPNMPTWTKDWKEKYQSWLEANP